MSPTKWCHVTKCSDCESHNECMNYMTESERIKGKLFETEVNFVEIREDG